MNETELLFTEVLNCNRQELYLNRDRILNAQQGEIISRVLKRRINAEPIQYILGKTEFMGLEFKVNSSVLIPRPETEILVETVLNRASCFVPPVSCLDIGTGSGCIAVSLAKFLPNVTVTATDISDEALEIARYNATLNNVADKIRFSKSNLFTNHEPCTTNHDIIVCNPPYIPTHEIATLQPEVQYEPKIALDGGRDGLDFYRRIINESPYFLESQGLLVMEMGFGQCPRVKEIFKEEGKFEIIDVVRDYSGIERVIVVKKCKCRNQ